jgi:steroid delta-isomerase-like uncharacterized protein
MRAQDGNRFQRREFREAETSRNPSCRPVHLPISVVWESIDRSDIANREEANMARQDNIKTQEEFGAAVSEGKLDKIRELMTAGVVDHDPAPGQGPGPEGFIRFFEKFREAFPDLKVTGDYVVIDDNNIAAAYTFTGTHKGTFMGIPPTGRKISARGVQIARFENGKIAERWGSSDELGILRQIGAKQLKVA